MSIIRHGSRGKWEDIGSMYVYFRVVGGAESGRLTGLDGATEAEYIEVVMRTLEQSGELNDEALDKCHAALRERFRLGDGDE